MINVKTKVHDRFSIEFKVGFEGSKEMSLNEFAINTWIFLPYSLDINAATYSKQQFHTDVKSNVRLITPDFSFSDLSNANSVPFSNLRESIAALGKGAPEDNYRFHTQLFASIFKSAIRDEVALITQKADAADTLIQPFLLTLEQSLSLFRSLEKEIPSEHRPDFILADEYISLIAELQLLRLLDNLNTPENLQKFQEPLIKFIRKEHKYKKAKGYQLIKEDDIEANARLISRHNLLKKHAESALYLHVDTKKDGKTVEQFWFGIAAGVAMILSTLIALPFQHYWGQYPTFIFIILVIAYMLKDRTKEMMRGIFANQLKNRYFDTRTNISLGKQPIGWMKESMDFVPTGNIPQPVLDLRHYSDIEKNSNLERIILYRKRVRVDNRNLRGRYSYDFEGINDIMRFHLSHITQKMDDPIVHIQTLDGDNKLIDLPTPRTYTLTIVMQFQEADQPLPEYKSFRITATRDGIVSIQ